MRCLRSCRQTLTYILATAQSGDGAEYKVEIDTFKECDPEHEDSKWAKTGRQLKLQIMKKDKEDEEHWPRLTKEKVKLQWLVTDWSLYVDEDEEDDEELTEEQQAMLEVVIGNFTQMKGRPPTELELIAIMNQLNAKIADVGSDEDSDVNEGDLSGEDDEDEEDDEDDDGSESESC